MKRFWDKVDICGPDECWEWQAAKTKGPGSYGVFYFDRRLHTAHRVALFLDTGVFPEGGVVRHTCDNPPCCNPAHLLVGTHADNVRDKVERGRHPRGEAHSSAKLTKDEMLQIRGLASSGLNQTYIGSLYDIAQQTVSDINCGRRWVRQ